MKSSIPQDGARIPSASGQPQRRTAIGRGREEYIRLVLDSVDEQDNESTAENRSMLAFFDSLVHRESLGDLGDALDDDSSESLDSDDVAVTAGRRARTVNFERWSDVQSSGDEDDRMVRRSRVERSSSSGGESEESSDNNPLPHPANGVISRLRRKMKYR